MRNAILVVGVASLLVGCGALEEEERPPLGETQAGGWRASAIDFGGVLVGTVTTLAVVVENDESTPLHLSFALAGADAGAFRVPEDPVEIPAGGSGSIPFAFAPGRPGAHAAQAEVRACEGCEPVALALRGDGVVISVVAAPASLDFGRVPPGAVAVRELSLRNDGSVPVELRAVSLVADGSDFGLPDTGRFPRELDAGGSVSIDVQFAPPVDTDFRVQQNQLVVEYGAGERLVVPLVATPGGAVLQVTPEAIDFGFQPVGRTVSQVITITNAAWPGESNVTGASIVGPGAASFEVEILQATGGAGAPVGGPGDVVNVNVSFFSNQPGSFTAQVEIHTTDAEQPLLVVPVQAEVLQLPPCNLVMRPDPLRFGLVPAGSVATREVTVVNAGDDACLIWDVELMARRQDGSWVNESTDFFSTAGVPTDTAVVPAGGILPLHVRFNAVSAPQDVLLTTGLRFAHSAVGAGFHYVPASAMATRFQPSVTPNPVRFGPTPQGFPATLDMSVTNLGGAPFRVIGATVAPGSAPDFGVLAISGTSTPLVTSIDQAVIRVRYTPDAEGSDRGVIQIHIDGVPEPLLVDVSGIGTTECGEPCLGPVATCPASIVSTANNQVTLVGDAVDPTDDPVHCTWRVVTSPAGSRSGPGNAAQCITTFTPDIVGEYILEFTATDYPMGNEASCTTSVRADPPGGLWIEMFWDRAGDMDLHLLHPDAGDPAFFSTWTHSQLSCFYSNCVASRGAVREWDLPGPSDNPSLDRDDIAGTGPENIRIDQPSVVHRYAAGFRNFSHGRTPVQVNYNIYCDGELAHGDVYTSNTTGEFVWVGDLTFQPTGGCSFRHENRVVLR